MREKFVHIASLCLILVLLLTLTAPVAYGDPRAGLPDWLDAGSGDGEESAEPGETQDLEDGEAPEEEEPDLEDGESPGEEEPDPEDPEPSESVPPEETPPEESGPVYLPPESEYTGIGSKIMRIGIYYGSNGRSSVELKLTAGDGFWFGIFDSDNSFIPDSKAGPVQAASIFVKADPGNKYGFLVEDKRGNVLYSFDDSGVGTGLAVMPYSGSGERTKTKCGYTYYGGFRFERFNANNELMTVVNYVELDDYIKGVVPYEMSASWPVEALKAQAVAARTYALSRVNTSHRNGYHFDLCDGDDCQVYKGIFSGTNAEVSNAAVDETSGLTVQYGGEYCQTLFCSSNGGATESNRNVYTADLPYLTGVIDPYEALIADKISNYAWTRTFTGKELQKKLVDAGYTGCGVITGVQTTLSDTGNVIALTFQDANGKSYTRYKNSCRTFLSLRSLHYTVTGTDGVVTDLTGAVPVDLNGDEIDLSQGVQVISGDGSITTVTEGCLITAEGVVEIASSGAGPASGTTGTSFTFSGTGWGHNLGMSQYGAYAMAELGFGFREILGFYYTGVTVA